MSMLLHISPLPLLNPTVIFLELFYMQKLSTIWGNNRYSKSNANGNSCQPIALYDFMNILKELVDLSSPYVVHFNSGGVRVTNTFLERKPHTNKDKFRRISQRSMCPSAKNMLILIPAGSLQVLQILNCSGFEC